MHKYFIESFKISKLWGYLDIDLDFNSDVNILIGPNGSGKTTILNLLHSVLSLDSPSFSTVKFDRAQIKLRGFKGTSVRTVTVDAAAGLLKLRVGKTEYKIDINTLFEYGFYQSSLFNVIGGTMEETHPADFSDVLTALVPIVWLPVNRQSPVTEGENERYTKTDSGESADLRLEQLLGELSNYHSRLNTQLSTRYKEFEHQVLSTILYSKEEDQLNSISDAIAQSLSTEDEKEHLRGAFETAGLLNEQMEIKINNHFDAAEEVLKRIKKHTELGLEDILVLPLISRTKSIVEFARKLEEERKAIFAPLRRYEDIVNLFLNGKSVAVDENGNLNIVSSSLSELTPHFLSSGEKQILILLTQALVRGDEPVVYIADEPELSLHVTWQEKLLESLVTLGGQIQVIVATHSPDIVGRFRDKVIQLGGKS